MAKKKHTQPTANAVEKRQNKKERRAAQEKKQEEYSKTRKSMYNLALMIVASAIFISFWGANFRGGIYYGWIQAACYAMMGLSGLCIMNGSRYEVGEKKQRNMGTMGMVFLMIALGMGLGEIAKMLIHP